MQNVSRQASVRSLGDVFEFRATECDRNQVVHRDADFTRRCISLCAHRFGLTGVWRYFTNCRRRCICAWTSIVRRFYRNSFYFFFDFLPFMSFIAGFIVIGIVAFR